MDYKKIEAEKRKKTALTKKKDLSKITEEELQTLLGIAEDKIKKLEYKLCNTLPRYFRAIDDIIEEKGSKQVTIKLLGNKIQYFVNLNVTRLKNSLVIKEPVSDYEILEENFLSRNNKIISPKQNYSKMINIFDFIYKVFVDLNGLILEYSVNTMDKMVIDKTNINAFIKDIDYVLKWFYANPAINSATASESQIMNILSDNLSGYLDNRGKYDIIKEEALYDESSTNTKYYVYLSRYQAIIEFNGNMFKIEININRSNNSKDLTINLYKWSDTNGWLFIDRIKNYSLLHKIPEPTYQFKPDNLDIYKDGSIDICLIEALKYLHKFSGIKFIEPKYMELKIS